MFDAFGVKLNGHYGQHTLIPKILSPSFTATFAHEVLRTQDPTTVSVPFYKYFPEAILHFVHALALLLGLGPAHQ